MRILLVLLALGCVALARPSAAQSGRQATTPTRTAPNFEFRGNTFGKPLVNGPPRCSEGSCYSFNDHIGPSKVTLSYQILDGAFERLIFLFKPRDFDDLLTAFTEKWGAPVAVTSPPFRTVGGTSTTNTVAEWKFSDGELTLQRYGPSLTDGAAQIASPKSERASEEKRREEAAQAAKKDM